MDLMNLKGTRFPGGLILQVFPQIILRILPQVFPQIILRILPQIFLWIFRGRPSLQRR